MLGRVGGMLAAGFIAGIGCGSTEEPADSSGATTVASTGQDTTTSTTTTTEPTTGPTGSTAPATDTNEETTTGGDVDVSCPTVRSETDRPDDSDAPQVRVLYVLPSDGPDDSLDIDGTLCTSVMAFNNWLADATGGEALRLDTADGELDIGFVRLDLSDAVMHGSTQDASVETGVAYVRDRLERELLLGGHLVEHKLYAVYYGGTSEYACGGGCWPPTIQGQVAAMYLRGQPPGASACDSLPWGDDPAEPGYVDYAMLHELVHTLGFIEIGAPGQHSSGHLYDESATEPNRDLMYAPRDMSDPPWDIFSGLLLDPTGSQYWDHGDPDRLDLRRSAFLDPLPPDAELPPGW